MEKYTLTSGEVIEFPTPSPQVSEFIARVRLAADDPSVSIVGMIELIYGPENPILDHAMHPGRAMVTREVFANPIYHLLADLITIKRVQAGALDLSQAKEDYTVSVAEAAKRLGITTVAVRAAIAAKKLTAIYTNGKWWLTDRTIDAYKVVAGRGPKPKAKTGPVVVACIGSEPGHSMAIRVQGGDLIRDSKTAALVTMHFPAMWSRAIVRTTTDRGSRAFEIEPAAGAEEEIVHGSLYVRGAFRIVKKHNSQAKAAEAWEAFAPATTDL